MAQIRKYLTLPLDKTPSTILKVFQSDKAMDLLKVVLATGGLAAWLLIRFKRSRPDEYHIARYVGREPTVEHNGSCFCGLIHFSVKAPPSLIAFDCTSKVGGQML